MTKDNLLGRVGRTIDVMAEAGTRIGDTMIDVTPDRVGIDALDWVMAHAANDGRMQVRCAAYTPLGFSDAEPQRWEIFEKGVAKAEFIGSLPERTISVITLGISVLRNIAFGCLSLGARPAR